MQARRVAPPPDLPDDCVLTDAGYVDAYGVTSPDATERPAEAWMRAVLEGGPSPLRWFVQIGWRLALGFRPSRAANISGWPIVSATADRVILQQASPLMTARLVLRHRDNRLVWVTSVRYESNAARVVWLIVGALHRRIVPYLLSRAVSIAAPALRQPGE